MPDRAGEKQWVGGFLDVNEVGDYSLVKGPQIVAAESLHYNYFHMEDNGISAEMAQKALDEAKKVLGEEIVNKMFLEHANQTTHTY